MPSTSAVLPGFDDDLERLVAPVRGTVSVWLGGLDGARRSGRDEAAVHYAASTMKLPLVLAAYRLHEAGRLDLDAPVEVHNRFASALDGSPFSLDQGDDQDDDTWALLGRTCSLRRLAEHAIVRSGNLATNLLLERVGADAVAAVLADAGCSAATALPRGIGDAAAREAGLDNLVTAVDLARVLAGIGHRTLAAASTCAAVEEVLTRQEHRAGVPAGLPAGTEVANKTGWVTGVSHDVALVRPTDAPAYVLAVLTSTDLTEEQGSALIAGISAAAWEVRNA
ncbi:MAG: serine hydrolase [Nocardioidaceae bacterium]